MQRNQQFQHLPKCRAHYTEAVGRTWCAALPGAETSYRVLLTTPGSPVKLCSVDDTVWPCTALKLALILPIRFRPVCTKEAIELDGAHWVLAAAAPWCAAPGPP